jgi:hypothetical protein
MLEKRELSKLYFIHIHIHIHICICICICICIYVCMYVCMYVCIGKMQIFLKEMITQLASFF